MLKTLRTDVNDGGSYNPGYVSWGLTAEPAS